MSKQLFRCAAIAALAFSISACGSKVPRPSTELALAGSALKSAELSGAREFAPIELSAAREKQAAANAALAQEKFLKARYLTIEARADAELARAAAEAEKSRQELKRAYDSIEVLRGGAEAVSTGQ